MPKARPDVARRAQRARRRDPLRRPENVDVPVPSAEEVVPVLTKLGMDASAPAIETGDKVWALASIATLLADDNRKQRRLLLSHKVVPRVLYALQSDTNLEVRREASGALRNLCLCGDDEILAEIANKRGVEIVLSVMKWAALGLQSHERRLERARAPLIEERERLMAKPLDQMNRKERRHMAKLAQGRLPDATAGATAEFGGESHDAFDMHAWGTDAPTSLQAMDSTAAQCLIETCESLVTCLSSLCELSEKISTRALHWSWHTDLSCATAPASSASLPSAFVGEGLSAWLCEALSLGTRACKAEDPELARLPECLPALLSLGIACAQALWVLTDSADGGGTGELVRSLCGRYASTLPKGAAMPTPADERAALQRARHRLECLMQASSFVAPDAAPRAAILGAAACGTLVHVYAFLCTDADVQNEDESQDVQELSSFVQERIFPRVMQVLKDAQPEMLREDTQSALEVCLELVADMGQAVGPDVSRATWQPTSQLIPSPLMVSLLRLAAPSPESATENSVTATARRAIETRALAALNNLLWYLALHAPPVPSELPGEDDHDAWDRIHAWRAWAGTQCLEWASSGTISTTTAITSAHEALVSAWNDVFAIAAFWAGVEDVANAAQSSTSTPVSMSLSSPDAHQLTSSVANDGLAQVSTCIGCLWSIARMLEGQLPLVQPDSSEPTPVVTALMAAYYSAQDASVRVKVLGTMACLARSQHYKMTSSGSSGSGRHGAAALGNAEVPSSYMHVYTSVADFWADVAGHVPDPETLTALLHAIVDTYADERAPWDSVYRATHLHEKLCSLMPRFMAMAKRVDRRVDPAMYRAVQESVETMDAFLAYRQNLP